MFEAAGPLAAFKLCRRDTRVNEFGIIPEGEIPVSLRAIHFNEIGVHASFSITPRAMQVLLRLMEKGPVDSGSIILMFFVWRG